MRKAKTITADDLVSEAQVEDTCTASVKAAIGARYGRLVVVGRSGRQDGKNVFWNCKCDCGGTAVVTSTRLRSGHTSSCGCWQKESREALALARRNPLARELRIWRGMLRRCYEPTCHAFKWYGGRGIGVCDAWRKSFLSFVTDMGPSEGLELDRIRTEGHYEPDNCRWVTHAVNQNNKRNNVRIEHDGMNLTLAEWGRHSGIPSWKIRRLLLRGHTLSFIFEENGHIG